jgi:hypothetical protein
MRFNLLEDVLCVYLSSHSFNFPMLHPNIPITNFPTLLNHIGLQLSCNSIPMFFLFLHLVIPTFQRGPKPCFFILFSVIEVECPVKGMDVLL